MENQRPREFARPLLLSLGMPANILINRMKSACMLHRQNI
jgi:hypothetical protein